MSEPPRRPLKCPHCGSVSLNVSVKAWAFWYRGKFDGLDNNEYVELLEDPLLCRDCGKESPFAAAEEEGRQNQEGILNE